MDHIHIDENHVAERYLKRSLSPQQRADFEAHLVDCQECSDRLLLAEMFQARSPSAPSSQPNTLDDIDASLILRVRRKQVALMAATILMALAAPILYMLWRSA